MKKTIYNKVKKLVVGTFSLLLPLSSFLVMSCDDWLDVRGENVQKEQDQYEAYKGFRDALVGCYMTMGSRNIYGQKLTMTDVESLASMWYVPASSAQNLTPLKYCLTYHDYSQDEAIAAIKTIYSGLFTTISSANVLIKNLEEKGGNVQDNQARDVMLGEAYALRAYCQLDVLRLFGQLPSGGTKQVKLPYSYTTGIDEMPSYFGYSEYIANLKADIEKAEGLLKNNDPIFEYTFTQLNNAPTDVTDLYYYRQSRLNYWAVRALHARMSLYIGENAEAYSIAKDVIQNGPVTLSGISDLQNGYNGLPSECLFYLSKYDLLDYAASILRGGVENAIINNSDYSISQDMLNDLYASIPGATASHNRYLNEWNRMALNNANVPSPTLKKYWYDASKYPASGIGNANILMIKLQIIPMLRLSEVYLIAMETSNSLEDVQQLYDTYMSACAFTLYEPFTSLEEARAEIVNEYRRELFGEGQMFYTYKRKAAKSMLWNSNEIKEEDYILPLPATEYDPSLIKNNQ